MLNIKFVKATLIAAAAILMASCSGNKGNFPKNFATMGDEAKVDYMMKNATPDSVARFICLASLGNVPEAPIDSMPLAVAYAYDHYTSDDDLSLFSEAYESYRGHLPLADMYRLYTLSGEFDQTGLGIQLGLTYVNKIRENKMSVAQIEKDIADFKKSCGTADTTTYNLFIKGFKTVLEIDRGKDLSEEVYNKFIKM